MSPEHTNPRHRWQTVLLAVLGVLWVGSLVIGDTPGSPVVAVIAVSGYALPETVQKVGSAGAVSCMSKMFDARELVQVIAQARGRL